MVRILSKVNRLYRKEEVMSNETNSSVQFLRNTWAPNLATHSTFQKPGQCSFYKTSFLPTGECTLTSVSPLLETCIISCLMAAGHIHKASVLWIAHTACSCATELSCPSTDDKWKNRCHVETKQSLICEDSQLSCNPDSAWTMGFQWQRFYQWIYDRQSSGRGIGSSVSKRGWKAELS